MEFHLDKCELSERHKQILRKIDEAIQLSPTTLGDIGIPGKDYLCLKTAMVGEDKRGWSQIHYRGHKLIPLFGVKSHVR